MSIENTLTERGIRYGAFVDHAKISQSLQDCMRACNNWNNLEPIQKQALSTIMDKVARILNGDPYYEDNWHDICGYSKLVETWLETRKTQTALGTLATFKQFGS